jgi:eukaryotic-like serine/threonine-protein kinase
VKKVDGTRTDIRDPRTGNYLRVDWTDTPGPSAVQAWRDFAPVFASRNEGYREIRIEPTTYKGFQAAIWEFTYRRGSTTLHAVDLGFVTGTHGFALNFQTTESTWRTSQPIFDSFKASFEVPTGR